MTDLLTSETAPTNGFNLPLSLVWFETAMPNGPALGEPETMKWGDFISIFSWRREGSKDGSCFCPARFTLEPDGRHVRRLKANLIARTAIALDIETSKSTGEVPPGLDEAMDRAQALGLTALGYTSHNHKPGDIRYRLVFPLSVEIQHELPAPEVMAERLGLLGVLDMSKIGAASLFYLPSLQALARALTAQGVKTPRGGAWTATAVRRTLAQIVID